MAGPAASDWSATTAGPREAPAGHALREAIGSLPFRLQMAGGWIDQPWLSSLNPEPPGSMVVVSLEPTVRYMDRSGMATGTRAEARALWGDAFPADRTPASLVRELYAAENADLTDPSGSQDMCGLIYPGVSRLDYDADVDGGWFPAHVESTTDPEVIAWLERVIHLVPIGQRPPGYGPLGDQAPGPGVDRAPERERPRLLRGHRGDGPAGAGRVAQRVPPGPGKRCCRRSTCTRRSPSTCWAWCAAYAAEHAGAMLSGCGGGYVIVASGVGRRRVPPVRCGSGRR